MLPRKKLIPLKSELRRIKASGKLYDSPAFGLIVAYQGASQQGLGASNAKAAFIVSKKIDKRSTVRHQVKRKLSEAIFPFLPRLPKNVELVFLAKVKAIETEMDLIKKELENVLRRARLL